MGGAARILNTVPVVSQRTVDFDAAYRVTSLDITPPRVDRSLEFGNTDVMQVKWCSYIRPIRAKGLKSPVIGSN